MTENSEILDILNRLLHDLHGLDYPGKVKAEEYIRFAMRVVAHNIVANNAKKTGELEYIRGEVAWVRELLVEQNTTIANSLREAREIGGYLMHLELMDFDGFPQRLKDMGIPRRKADSFMKTAYISDREFEEWVSPYINVDQVEDKELSMGLLLEYVRKQKKKSEL